VSSTKEGAHVTYEAKKFDLKGLRGISDEALTLHFKLYEGYVKGTNTLTAKIDAILKDGTVDHEETPAYSELTRRLGFEYNGMVLHEYYFGNLARSSGQPSGAFRERAEQSFGSFDLWKADFAGIGNMRGVGWAICYENPANGRLSNHWITLHEHGNVAGFRPILVMDVWEHAYMLDYGSERAKYVDAFFANVAWPVADQRLSTAAKAA
jgi:Fe-Mn family superoxide dismutase